MMDIIKFLDKTWGEIPDQDNPVMYNGWYDKECLVIFRGQYHRIEGGGYVVAKVGVGPGRDVTSIGVFWREDFAIMFAESIATQPKITRVTTEHVLSTLLTDDFAITVHFDYQPDEPESLIYPGCKASVELNSVCLGTHDLMPVLSESVLSELADKCLESMNAKQRDN